MAFLSATAVMLTGMFTLLTLHEMHPTDPVVTPLWRIFRFVVIPLITAWGLYLANKARREREERQRREGRWTPPS